MKRYQHNSTLPAPTKPIARVNEARREREFRRTYFSEERVKFVKSLGCLVRDSDRPGNRVCSGPIENAHIRIDGIGRKAHYTEIVNLCRRHHEILGASRPDFESSYCVNLDSAAHDVELGWLRYAPEVER